MPTLAELRRQVRHTLMAVAGLESPEQVPEPVRATVPCSPPWSWTPPGG
jgi:hypothetical protein